jgi:hypothetical protein
VPFSDCVQLDDSEDTSSAGTGNCVQMPATEALHEKVTVPLPDPPLLLEHAASTAIHTATAHDTHAQRAIGRAYNRPAHATCDPFRRAWKGQRLLGSSIQYARAPSAA